MVCIVISEGFEEIEALTVVDVLRRVDVNITMVSISDSLYVKGSHDIIVKCDAFIKDVNLENADMVILPGGMPGTKNLDENETLSDALAKRYKSKRWIAAICAAPMILGKKGFLKNKKSTCFPGFEKFLEGSIVLDERVITDDFIITSKGAGTALDFAFEIVKNLKSEKIALDLKHTMQA